MSLPHRFMAQREVFCPAKMGQTMRPSVLSPQMNGRGVRRISWDSQSCCLGFFWFTETSGRATWKGHRHTTRSLLSGVLLPLHGSVSLREPAPSAPGMGKDVSPVPSLGGWDNAFILCVCDYPQHVTLCMKGVKSVSILCVLNDQSCKNQEKLFSSFIRHAPQLCLLHLTHTPRNKSLIREPWDTF